VAKRRDSVALFEVIQKAGRSEGNMAVPKWMDRQGAVEAPGDVAPRPEPASRAISLGVSEPLVSIVDDRLRVSLSYVSGALVVLALVVLVAGGFALGRWSAPGLPAAIPDGQSLREKTPLGRHVLGKANPVTPGDNAKAPPAPSARQKDKYYLVIQFLPGLSQKDMDNAARIAAFCDAHGEPATVARFTHPGSAKQRYIVWSLRPFGEQDSPEALAYAQKIEDLGKQYMREAPEDGRYNFQQRKRAGASLTPQFEPYR
jgi:hypothetical protein